MTDFGNSVSPSTVRPERLALIPLPESVALAEASSPRAAATAERITQPPKSTAPEIAARRSFRIGQTLLLPGVPRPLTLKQSRAPQSSRAAEPRFSLACRLGSARRPPTKKRTPTGSPDQHAFD